MYLSNNMDQTLFTQCVPNNEQNNSTNRETINHEKKIEKNLYTIYLTLWPTMFLDECLQLL